MGKVGHFEPHNPSQEWNRGKGTPLVCPDCREDALTVVLYDGTSRSRHLAGQLGHGSPKAGDVLVDCGECGAVGVVAIDAVEPEFAARGAGS